MKPLFLPGHHRKRRRLFVYSKWPNLTASGLVLGLFTFIFPGYCDAQELDKDFFSSFKTHPAQVTDVQLSKPPASPNQMGIYTPYEPGPNASSLPVGIKPLTASVSKTLYLPPAMYGQWTIIGTVKETNISDLNPVASDIWILQREGNQVTVSNPANGASAAINVDTVEGNTATFHRFGQSGRILRSETVTLTVQGDQLFGKNLRKEELIKEGKIIRTNYALFDLQGTRISGASVQFRPDAVENGPDIEIQDVQRQR